MRNASRANKVETACKPFTAVKESTGVKNIDGVDQKVYRFSRYGGAPAAKPADAPAPAAPTPPAAKPADASAPIANENPFLKGSTRNAITAALKAAGFTSAPADLAFLFANIIPNVTLSQVGDAHPHITPDEFLKRIPEVARKYQEFLDSQTQPDPDDDPKLTGNKPTSGQSSSAPAKLYKQLTESNDKPSLPRASRQRHPLEGERVEIDRIEVAKDRNGWKMSEKWVAHGTAISANNVECQFKLNIWKEDARHIREAGYAFEWPSASNDYAPVLTNPAIVVIVEMRSSGLSIAQVEPAVHPARREA